MSSSVLNVDDECKVDGVSHVARDPPHGAVFDAGSEAKIDDQGGVPGQLEACVEVQSSADELETTGFGSDPQIGPCKQRKFSAARQVDVDVDNNPPVQPATRRADADVGDSMPTVDCAAAGTGDEASATEGRLSGQRPMCLSCLQGLVGPQPRCKLKVSKRLRLIRSDPSLRSLQSFLQM
jgi:hypothetical protein